MVEKELKDQIYAKRYQKKDSLEKENAKTSSSLSDYLSSEDGNTIGDEGRTGSGSCFIKNDVEDNFNITNFNKNEISQMINYLCKIQENFHYNVFLKNQDLNQKIVSYAEKSLRILQKKLHN